MWAVSAVAVAGIDSRQGLNAVGSAISSSVGDSVGLAIGTALGATAGVGVGISVGGRVLVCMLARLKGLQVELRSGSWSVSELAHATAAR